MRPPRKLINNTLASWMIATLSLILILPVIMAVALLWKSTPIFDIQPFGHLITSSIWAPSREEFGFWPFIFGSIYVTAIAFIITAPLCLFAAIYLTQFSSRYMLQIMHPVIDILAGIPSVIYGLWGIIAIVPLVGEVIAPALGLTSPGYSVLAGGIVVAVMCIPYIINVLLGTFGSVPSGLKEATLSLGATHWEMVKHVILKKSLPGIISAFGLGITKAFGETLAVMMVVGNMVKVSLNPLEPGYPLPALIANNYGEMMSIPLYDSALMLAAFILLVVILTINLFFRYFSYKYQ